ncbi:hypothetical protein PTKIN_Ptkin02bG0039500 [Pterospermum kingtungense]
MAVNSATPVIGGRGQSRGTDGNSKNSNQRLAADIVRECIEDAIMKKLDVESFFSTSNIICLADFRCGVGPNTLNQMQDLLQLVKNKYMSQCPASQMPEFQLPVARIQFAEDLDNFLNARAREIVSGGMMVIVGSSIPDRMPHSQIGSISEAEVDSFNLPVCACPPGEFIGVERNGLFTVEMIELMNPAPWIKSPIDIPGLVKHVRDAMERIINKHFSGEATDELFNQLLIKVSEIFSANGIM